ncbi:MAG: response regulator transcription factor, partial [Candidatus Sericytochromatia bacterium]
MANDANKIMIVEDDPSAKRLLELVLGAEGFKLVAFDNGAEALAAIDQFRPDLVLLDLMLPEMDGIEFSRKVRARR